jgi:glycosyltransferase involved in cell wall biosynthesis
MGSQHKIKILLLTPTLQCGGSEKFVSLVCNYLNTNLFSVCLVVVNNAKPFYQITNKEIEIIDLKKTRVLFSLAAIKKTVRKFKPDIVFSTANHLNLYIAIFKHQFNRKIKFIAREASMVSINSREAKIPALYSWLIKQYYKRFDLIICQAKEMQSDLVQYYNIQIEKAVVIHNATPDITGNLNPAGRQNADRAFTFITVARLTEIKGIARLIRAVGLLPFPFQYYIIGAGNKKGELQNQINELQLQQKVHLMGEKPEPFAGNENADLFLMGSYYEGFPNVLLEAGARGIPVIAFDVPGGIKEIITEDNGVMVKDDDVVAFANAIKSGLASNFNRNLIIELTRSRFSVTRILPQLENIFLKIASNK